MTKMTLQVPVSKTLKLSAERVALEQGFSSLQEMVRLFLAQIAKRALTIGFSPTIDEILTSREEAVLIKKYEAAQKEIKKGKGKQEGK